MFLCACQCVLCCTTSDSNRQCKTQAYEFPRVAHLRWNTVILSKVKCSSYLGRVLRSLKGSQEQDYFHLSQGKGICACEVRLCSCILDCTCSSLIKLFNNILNTLEIIWVMFSTEFVEGCVCKARQFERDDELAWTLTDVPTCVKLS